MRNLQLLPMFLSLTVATAFSGLTHAQEATAVNPAPVTRAQVKMETAEFLRTHRWSEADANWVLKSGVEPPSGVKTRAEIKAETTKFLRENRWDEGTSSWISLNGQPRELSTLTRAQMRAETRQFIRTHRFDEATQTWVDNPQPKKK